MSFLINLINEKRGRLELSSRASPSVSIARFRWQDNNFRYTKYEQTPRITPLLHKSVLTQLINKFPTWRSNTVLTRSNDFSLFSARWIQYTHCYPIYLRSIAHYLPTSAFIFQVVKVRVKVKVKFALEQATRAQRGSRGIALLFP